jgi:hypothetical protein
LIIEQGAKLENVKRATAPLLLDDVIDGRHSAFSSLLVRGIEAMSVKARVIYGEHQNRPACERETIQQGGITAPEFLPYGPKPHQDLFRRRFSRRFEKIDMLQSVIAPGTQDDAVAVMQIGASRPVHGAFGHRMVRQQYLELLRDVGLAWTHVRAVINYRIAKKDDDFLCIHWTPFSQSNPGLPPPFRTVLPGDRTRTSPLSRAEGDTELDSQALSVRAEGLVHST